MGGFSFLLIPGKHNLHCVLRTAFQKPNDKQLNTSLVITTNMATTLASSKLFQPLNLGHNTLQHRIMLAPLTRNRNDNNHAPIPNIETHYADRASTPGTIIISEATATSHDEEGQRNIPGFNTDAHVAARKSLPPFTLRVRCTSSSYLLSAAPQLWTT